jgi:alpha-tubulin suppressor-like RCC1 family protein
MVRRLRRSPAEWRAPPGCADDLLNHPQRDATPCGDGRFVNPVEGVMATHVKCLMMAMACLAIAASHTLAGTATQVAAGRYHTCALTTGGDVLCWGRNGYGQLGDGTNVNKRTPTAVPGPAGGVTALAAGDGHTCALTVSGGVVCWGWNVYGQLGDGTTTDRWTPTPVWGLASGIAAIAAGDDHTCALTTGGGVMCWGRNAYGQLGDWTTTNRSVPTQVWGLESGIAALAPGSSHTCALTTGGGVECWGANSNGQVGDGTNTQRLTPTGFFTSGIAAISAGGWHTCALVAGSALGWGDNVNGQVGDGTTTDRWTPTAVSDPVSVFAAIDAGEYHTCALTTGGAVKCWGRNDNGQLGDGTTTQRLTPKAAPLLASGVAAVTAGGLHTCALEANLGVVCWGDNYWGQVGDGTSADRWVPTPVVGLEGRRSSGADFTDDLKTDVLWRHASLGEVWLWPMDGAAHTAETFVRTVADINWEIRGLGDQNRDGYADILWRNRVTGQVYLWLTHGSAPLSELYVATVDPAYDIIGTGDFNGDGRSDILWRHLAWGDVWMWLMNGRTLLAEGYIDRVDPGYVVKGVDDLNADQKADLVWHHATRGEVWVWLMDGKTRLTEAYVDTVADTGYQIVGLADHTGDRKADILWRHVTRGEVWMWMMSSATRLAAAQVGTVPDTGYRIAGSGDYDGDGRADILWHHATQGEVWVWLMNGTMKLSEGRVGSVPDIGYQIAR